MWLVRFVWNILVAIWNRALRLTIRQVLIGAGILAILLVGWRCSGSDERDMEERAKAARTEALEAEVAELKARLGNKVVVDNIRKSDDKPVQVVPASDDPWGVEPAEDDFNTRLAAQVEAQDRKEREELARQTKIRVLKERERKLQQELERRGQEQFEAAHAPRPYGYGAPAATTGYGTARPARNRISESDTVATCDGPPAGYSEDQVLRLHDDRGWLLVTFDNELPTVPFSREEWKLVNLGDHGSRMLPLIAPDDTCFVVPDASGYRFIRTYLFQGSLDSELGLRLVMVRDMGDGGSKLSFFGNKISAKSGVSGGREFETAVNWLARNVPATPTF